MNKLKKYAGLLNEEAPKDHFLAYITADERDMLVNAGGKKTSTPSGIFAYPYWDDGSGQSKSEYDAGGGYDDRGNQNTGGNNNNNDNDNRPDDRHSPHSPTGTVKRDFTKAELGIVDAEDEYMEPDKDHWKATQKAIKQHQKGDHYQADWSDWSKEQQETYQLEMNKLKGTEGKNYSFYKGNEGTTNLSFSEHWKDVSATNPIAAGSPLLRLLIAAGRTLKENFTTDYGTYKYGAREGTGSGRPFDQKGWYNSLFDGDGKVKEDLSNDQINEIYEKAIPDLPYLVGNAPVQETSMVDEYFKNANQQNLGISANYLATYNKAKADLAKTMNMTPNTNQYGYSGTMTASNIFYDYLKEQGLL